MQEKLDRQARQLEDLARKQRALVAAVAALSETQKAALGSTGLAVRKITALAADRGAPVRVAFLVHNFEAWGALRSVFRAMQVDPRFAPVVFSLPRLFPGARRYEGENLTSARLSDDGVPHIRLNDPVPIKDLDRIKSFEPEAIFRQSHWQIDIPSAFKTRNLTFAKQYYVAYAIGPISAEAGGGRIARTPKDLCERQFLASEVTRDVMLEQDRLNGLRLVVTGHPKVGEVLAATPAWPIASGNETRVIWSAHHSIGTHWSNYGVFPKVYDEMLALAKRRPDIDILFSPHPGLLTRIEAMEGEARQRVDSFFAEWNSLPNTGNLYDGRYQGPFQACDLLIIDGMSFLIEFQLVGKPIIHLSRPDRAPLNALGELVIKGAHELPAAQIDGIEAMIDGLLDGSIPLKTDQQQAVRDELLPTRDPAATILETIYDDLRPEAGQKAP